MMNQRATWILASGSANETLRRLRLAIRLDLVDSCRSSGGMSEITHPWCHKGFRGNPAQDTSTH